MEKRILAILAAAFLLLGLLQTNFHIIPLLNVEAQETYKEIWKIVNATNPKTYDTVVDINITVNTRKGVYIACSTNITEYFQNLTYWQSQGYTNWWDWLNGTVALPYHWDKIDWCVSNGSLVPISYDEIQYWGAMYMDSGGGVEYETFMNNTYMADWNLTDSGNDPDITSEVYWQGNEIKVFNDLLIPANSTINFVIKIVITEPGAYSFNLTTTPGVTISPSSWRVGGVATILVPYDYSTIQAAIDAANPGDTIIIDNGTYAEDLVIPSAKTNLEIKPDAGASVTVKGVQNVNATYFPLALPNIEINANGVRIHGLIIEGPDYTPGYYSSGMVIGASNIEVYNNTFKVTPAASIDEISQAIQTYHKNARPGIDISGLNIHDNKFMNLSAGAAGYEGIYINLDEGTGVVAIRNNKFFGGVVRAITTERSNTKISGNTIVTDLSPGLPGGYQGINIGGVNSGNVTDVQVTDNIINGSASGKGFQYGVKMGYSSTSTFTNVVVTNNSIEMNEVGVWIKFSANGVKVNYNNIVGNIQFGVKNTDPTHTVDARYNWWGDTLGPGNETGSTGDYVTSNVDFKPWLIQSFPPAVPVSTIYVDTSQEEFWTPAFGSTFVANVKVNVTMLAGFQFVLRWNGTLLNLTEATYFAPWSPYFEVNKTIRKDSFTLALSGRNNSVPYPFNGSTTLATLTFKVIYDPVFPENASCSLALEDVILSDPQPSPIPCLIYNGTYSIYATKPRVAFIPQVVVEKRVPSQFDVRINVTNIVNLHAFEFNVTYNPALINAMTVNVEESFNSSYSVAEQGINNQKGFVFVRVNSISPPVNGSGTLVRIAFKVVSSVVWPDPPLSCNLTLVRSVLLDPENVTLEHEALLGVYRYEPIKGDLNMDGTVELYDLVRVAQAFGSRTGDPNWDSVSDLIRDGVINILDVIVVASNYGRTG